LITQAPLITTISVTHGRKYGTFIPFLYIKPYFGESFKMPYQLEVPYTTGAFTATYCALDA
jgi:hypothetical protein